MVIVIADGLSRFRAVISIPDAGRYVVFVYQVTGIPCDATYLFFRSGGTYRPRIVTSVNQGRDTYCTVLEYAGDTAYGGFHVALYGNASRIAAVDDEAIITGGNAGSRERAVYRL